MASPREQEDLQPPVPLRHRPLLPVIAGFALGIALDNAWRPAAWLWPAMGGSVLLLTAWGLRRGLRGWGNYALAAIIMTAVGGLYHDVCLRRLPPYHLRNIAARLDPTQRHYYVIRGRAASEPFGVYAATPFEQDKPFAPPTMWLVRVEVTSLTGGDGSPHYAAGGLAVFVQGRRPDVAFGDELVFSATIKPNRRAGNPGEIDRAAIYAREGTYATASLADARAFRVSRPPWYASPRIAVGRLRRHLDERLDTCMRRVGLLGSAGVIRALVFGRRDALRPGQLRVMRKSGAFHFLAISGMHVGIFCLCVSWLLGLLVANPRLRVVLIVAALWGYVALTGLQVSALRAAFTLSLLLVAPLLGRQPDAPSAMAAAALAMLLIDPAELFSAGFQLTFLAVWAITCIYPQMHVIIWPWADFLAEAQAPEERSLAGDVWLLARSYLLLSAVVWLVTAPVLAFHFGLVSPAAPLLNLLIWPLLVFLLPACFLLTVLLIVGPWAAVPAVMAAAVLSVVLESAIRICSRLPGFGVHVARPAVWWLFLYYGAAATWTVRRRAWWGNVAFVGAVIVVALAFLGQEAIYRLDRRVRVIVADVGAGQAVLLRLPDRQAVLFDAGSQTVGRRVGVDEMMRQMRIERIGLVTVSHYDADHCNFLPYLAERYTIERMAVRKAADPSKSAKKVRAAVWRQVRQPYAVEEGWSFSASGLTARVLHPSEVFVTSPDRYENDRSLVIRGECAGMSFLLPGDVGREAMARLCADYGQNLRADVLLIPHHGAYEEGLREFVRLVHPRIAIASGLDERCDPRMRAVLAEQSIPLWTTGREGAIMLDIRPGRVDVSAFAAGRHMSFQPIGREDGE